MQRRGALAQRAIRRVLADPIAVVTTLVGLVPWLVQPGLVEPDTKTDLVVDPGRYLPRAWSAWSTHSGFGELQNQAYGYLFPMGPLFWLGHVIGMPGWAVQRVWWSMLLVVGALGAGLFARRVMGLTPTVAAVVGLLYALSPRVLSLLAQLSVETWPGMLLPWLLLTIECARRRAWSARRVVGATGVLVAALGGVNATASLVPLLGAGVYLLVAHRGRGIGPWMLGCVLGAAWWLGPLVVLGRYSYPFMEYIETARITTAVTSVPGVMRGASDWVAYIVDADGHPVWQSGWVIAQSSSSIVAGALLSAIGLAGLARWSVPQARWRALGVMLLVGAVGMGIAYVGAVSGPFAEAARNLLDGPLAPARNVHKLDPLVRLPLVLGVGQILATALRRVTVRPAVAGLVLPVRLDTGRRHAGRHPA